MTGILIATLVTVGGGLYYGAACLIWPFVRCRRCEGTGRRMAWWGAKAWRSCRRCRGSGARIRIGRRVWNYFARLRRESK